MNMYIKLTFQPSSFLCLVAVVTRMVFSQVHFKHRYHTDDYYPLAVEQVQIRQLSKDKIKIDLTGV